MASGFIYENIKKSVSINNIQSYYESEDKMRFLSTQCLNYLQYIPDDGEVMTILAGLKEKIAEIEFKKLNQKIDKNPDKPISTWRNKKEEIKSHLKKAISLYQLALGRNPSNGLLYALLSRARQNLWGTSNWDLINKGYKMAHKLFPQHGQTTLIYAMGMWRKSRIEKAFQGNKSSLYEKAYLNLFLLGIEQRCLYCQILLKLMWPDITDYFL